MEASNPFILNHFMLEQQSRLDDSKQSSIFARVKTWSYQNPEWWVWALASYVWIIMFALSFNSVDNTIHNASLIFCAPMESISGSVLGFNTTGILKEPSLSSNIQFALSNGIVPWIFMLIAMMFPLLNRPVRHINLSLQRKDAEFGILIFLLGYCFIWTLVGSVYLLIPTIVNSFLESTSTSAILNGIVFFIAAILVWLPSRAGVISRCEQTRPLHTDGIRLCSSCFRYGIQIGVNCFRMCWAPMLALMFAHHNFLLMLVVTAIMFYERYRTKHTSKFPGYAWGTVGFVLILFSYLDA